MNHKQHSIQCIRHGALGARWCLGIVVTISSAACAPSPDPEHHTVDYYRANAEAREAKVAECANDPGSLGKTPDCVNAKQAAAVEGIGSLRDLPPLGLGSDKEQNDTKQDSAGTSSSPDAPPQPR